MRHEQALEAASATAGDAEGGHLVGQGLRMQRGQALERGNHGAAPGKAGTTLVGPKLALARNHMTMIEASIPSTSSAMIMVIQKAGP